MTIHEYLSSDVQLESNIYYQNNVTKFNELSTLIYTKPRRYAELLVSQPEYADLYEWVKANTLFLGDLALRSNSEPIYVITHGLTAFPSCQTCGCQLSSTHNYDGITHGYRSFCSVKCQTNDVSTKLKRARTLAQSILTSDMPIENKVCALIDQFSTQSHIICSADPIFRQFVFDHTTMLDSSHSIAERLYWYRHGITKHPICAECGAKLASTNFISLSQGYHTYCSIACMANNSEVQAKKKQTCLLHYNVESPFNIDDVRQRAIAAAHSEEAQQQFKETSIKHWGVPHPMQNIDVAKRCTAWTHDAKRMQDRNNKIVETNRLHYGCDYYSQTAEAKARKKIYWANLSDEDRRKSDVKRKATCNERYGVDYILQLPQYHSNEINAIIQLRGNETKRLRGTFNTSKPEDRTYDLLTARFGAEDIERQYKCERYPFSCDFYIKSLDLFVECNYHWTHGKHWFDPECKADLCKLEELKAKAARKHETTDKRSLYDVAIYVWTELDPRKRLAASKAQLNYTVFWNEDEARDWIAHV